MKDTEVEITDIVDIVRNGPVGHGRMWEQEINFDAGFTPTPTTWKNVKKEWIDGKLYYVYS